MWFGDTMTMGDSQVYDKFLVIHPSNSKPAFKTYSLNGDYKRFTAVVGPAQSGNSCPDSFKEYGSFSISIQIDGDEVYYRNGYGSDAYDYVDIDLTGANEITIEVDTPQNSASCDHATIATPFIECENQCSPAVQSISATLSGDPHCMYTLYVYQYIWPSHYKSNKNQTTAQFEHGTESSKIFKEM